MFNGVGGTLVRAGSAFSVPLFAFSFRDYLNDGAVDSDVNSFSRGTRHMPANHGISIQRNCNARPLHVVKLSSPQITVYPSDANITLAHYTKPNCQRSISAKTAKTLRNELVFHPLEKSLNVVHRHGVWNIEV